MSLQPVLADLVFDQCYCSPLKRCRETLAILGLEIACTVDKQLREIDFGQWEGLRFDQVEQRFPGQIERWSSLQERFRFPGGDEIARFNRRVCCWFDKLLKNNFNHVLIVSHAGVMRIAICHLLGIDRSNAFAFSIGEAALVKVAVNDGFGRLEYFNSCR